MELNQPPVFALSPHLMSPETELHYLRQISELLVMFLLPRCYSLTPASHLMREILACKGNCVYLLVDCVRWSMGPKSFRVPTTYRKTQRGRRETGHFGDLWGGHQWT